MVIPSALRAAGNGTQWDDATKGQPMLTTILAIAPLVVAIVSAVAKLVPLVIGLL